MVNIELDINIYHSMIRENLNLKNLNLEMLYLNMYMIMATVF